MRGLWFVVALVACHRADAPAPVAPKGPTPCARASDSMVQVMLDRLSSKGPPPTEEADAFRNLIRERCEQDGWSAEATQCLIAMKQIEDAENCAKLMTEEQQAALVRDEQARFGARGDAAAPAGQAPPAVRPDPVPPAEPPAPPGAPAKERAKAKKTKDKGDPCSGGE